MAEKSPPKADPTTALALVFAAALPSLIRSGRRRRTASQERSGCSVGIVAAGSFKVGQGGRGPFSFVIQMSMAISHRTSSFAERRCLAALRLPSVVKISGAESIRSNVILFDGTSRYASRTLQPARSARW